MILFIGSWKKIVEKAAATDQTLAFALEEREDRYVLHGTTSATLRHGWQVSVEDRKLIIKGETETRTGDGKSFGYIRAFPFEESFTLPKDALASQVQPQAGEHGIKVEIPRLSDA